MAAPWRLFRNGSRCLTGPAAASAVPRVRPRAGWKRRVRRKECQDSIGPEFGIGEQGLGVQAVTGCKWRLRERLGVFDSVAGPPTAGYNHAHGGIRKGEAHAACPAVR